MIYLIVKIFVYLTCALALGIGGGWLLRNVQAAAREQSLERQLLDANGRLPPLESMLRSYKERLGGLRGELRSRDETLSLRNREIDGLERTLAELHEQLAAADRRAAANELACTSPDPAGTFAPEEPAGAHAPEQAARIEVLETALSGANTELEQARAALAEQQRRIASLMRERELQHAALRALEQRIEMTRDQGDGDDGRRVANR